MVKKSLQKDDFERQKKVIRQAEKAFKRETLATKRKTLDLAFEKVLILMKYNRGKLDRYYISTAVKIMEHPLVTYRALKYRLDRARANPEKLDRTSYNILYPCSLIVPNYVAVVSIFCSDDDDDDDDSIDDSTLSDFFNVSHSISSRPCCSYKPLIGDKVITPPIPADIVIHPLTYNDSNASLSSRLRKSKDY